ncbi:serine hydroxymethyltransferase [Agrobacterium rhizogenes]|nr:serine hydroxymethyltransferase [Rhizobium rhizogenes]
MLQDIELSHIIKAETERQLTNLSLIASENVVSRSVRSALSAPFVDKTVEGYPGRRYHAGCEVADRLENVTRTRACILFGAEYANVQPHSCTQANQAALLALVPPGGKILSMALRDGGHLSHGFGQSLTGRMFEVCNYGVSNDSHLIDYEQIEKLAHIHRPRVIIAGSSAYSRTIDFQHFRSIADSVDAYLLVDIAHVAGLVAGGVYPSPISYADIVTTSMYKTLRGARGGLILSRDRALGQRVDGAIFPGMQGTPSLNGVAAKAICLYEASRPEFQSYASQVVSNARYFSSLMISSGIPVISGGTDSHLVLLDLRPLGLTGRVAAEALEQCAVLSNMNLLPFDEAPPTICSGIRFGFAAATTIGLDENDIREIAGIVVTIFNRLSRGLDIPRDFCNSVRKKVSDLIAEARTRTSGPFADEKLDLTRDFLS